jgi:hypothetical protein
MLDALCEYLLEKPGLYRDEMVLFLLDEFKTYVTPFSIGRALASIGWTKKTIRRIAKGRNADLRDLYLYNTSHIRSWQYVFVDESGCDKRIGFRRTGWAPLGVTPTQEPAVLCIHSTLPAARKYADLRPLFPVLDIKLRVRGKDTPKVNHSNLSM